MIEEVVPSPLPTKRFRATLVDETGRVHKIDFGQKGSLTFIDHGSVKKKEAYWARHYGGNKTERHFIDNLIPSPALLSAFLLWGPSKDMMENVKLLNELFEVKHRSD
jgi:hypothetical protein